MVKKLKLVLCTTLLALSLLCMFIALNVKTTNAEGGFKMIDGASIRLTEDDSGIRYMAEVSDTTKDYYMLIVPEDFLTSKNITSDFVANLETEYPTQEFAKIACTPFDYLGKKVISASLVKLKDANFKRAFVGIAYYVDQSVYTYASFNEGKDIFANARNIAAVASAFLNDPNNAGLTDSTAIAKTIIGKAFLADDSSFGIKEESIDLTVGAIKTLSLDCSFDLNIKYSSNDETVATVDANGVVTAVSTGNAVITAKIEGTDYVDTCAVTVGAVSGNVWIDTNNASDELRDSSRVKCLETFDGEYGVISVTSGADSFVIAPRTAFDAENYAEYDAVRFKVKATSGLRVSYGSSGHFGFPVPFNLGGDEWTEYVVSFDKMKSGGVEDLANYVSDGSFYFANAGTLYIADATCIKLQEEKVSIFAIDETLLGSSGGVVHSSVTYDATEKAIKVTGTSEWGGRWMVSDARFIDDAKILSSYDMITFVIKNDSTANITIHPYAEHPFNETWGKYDIAINGKTDYVEYTFSAENFKTYFEGYKSEFMTWIAGMPAGESIYIKDIYLSKTPDKLSVFTIDETLLGSSGGVVHSSVTYDATEKAIKVTGTSEWGGRWMVAPSKIAKAENLLAYYDMITFVVKNDSTANITIHPYAENPFNETWGKYDIAINGKTDYVEYTFSAENFKTNFIGYKYAFMTWVGSLPEGESIYIKDIYLSKLPDKLDLINITSDVIVAGDSGQLSYDATEDAVKVAGNGDEWQWINGLRNKMANKDYLTKYSKVVFVVKSDSANTESVWFFPQESGSGAGYKLDVVSGDYAEYEFDIGAITSNYDLFNSQFEILLNSSTCNFFIQAIYVK